MTSRLLALILAVFIGSPTCWCCAQPVAQDSAPAAEHSCCAKKKQQHEPVKDGERCPCTMSQAQRGVEAMKTVVPAVPVATLPVAIIAEQIFSLPQLIAEDARTTFHDTGPPQKGEPVFLRQHSWLL